MINTLPKRYLLYLTPLVCQATTVDIYFLAGQSNALGAFTGEYSSIYDTAPSNVTFYNNGNLKTLVPDGTAPYYFGDGLEIELGRQFAVNHANTQYAIIKSSGAGQSLYNPNHWLADGTSSTDNDGTAYVRFQDTSAIAMSDLESQGYTPNIKGFIWVQGEADAAEGRTTEQYVTDLTNLIVDVRATYGDIPFIFTRLSDSAMLLDESTRTINRTSIIQAAQDQVHATVSDTYLINSNSFEFIGDYVHYSANGQIAHGEAVYSVIQSIPEPTSLSMILSGSFFLLANRKRS